MSLGSNDFDSDMLAGGQTVSTALVDSLTVPFDPDEVIALRDPTTWELTGASMTAGQLYVALASTYWQKALERDASASDLVV